LLPFSEVEHPVLPGLSSFNASTLRREQQVDVASDKPEHCYHFAKIGIISELFVGFSKIFCIQPHSLINQL
jgi:hypothetical protein